MNGRSCLQAGGLAAPQSILLYPVTNISSHRFDSGTGTCINRTAIGYCFLDFGCIYRRCDKWENEQGWRLLGNSV